MRAIEPQVGQGWRSAGSRSVGSASFAPDSLQVTVGLFFERAYENLWQGGYGDALRVQEFDRIGFATPDRSLIALPA
jgi:hypothetical protein